MSAVTLDRFDDYFRELHGPEIEPYSWQRRLAADFVNGRWPRAIDLPTGSGKTACIDIAIIALACQAHLPPGERTVPRRLFFCVNRRVIVDEACQRAGKIAEKLRDAERNSRADAPVLYDVAAALRSVAGTTPSEDVPPLDVLELRGGINRDNRWARSITQPAVICTTIDQLGSRLLFRGYGVSAGATPIQAALIAWDSLIVLDEAHISQPFQQTLDAVTRYIDPPDSDSLKWAEQHIGVTPLRVIPMTATPPTGSEANDEGPNANGTGDNVLRLDDQDREDPRLLRRLTAKKPAELQDVTNIVPAAVKAATELSAEQPTAVGIIVNRVDTAKQIRERLQKEHPGTEVELVIGSMRPIDRDRQTERLGRKVGPQRDDTANETSFVVATQCLEVGADYDFDVLITECASLDALRQRFGRLNRSGREIPAQAVILMERRAIKSEEQIEKQEKNKDERKRYLDPIYGNALARTWNWLQEQASEEQEQTSRGRTVTRQQVDFGIDAFDALLCEATGDGRIPSALLAPAASLNAPVMLPAYLDFWCQTSPRPVPDPDVSLFLHGPQGGEPDVQICWRADLATEGSMKADDWPDVVSLLPPTTAECMCVPISRVRRWLKAPGKGASSADDYGDLTGVAATDERDDRRNGHSRGALQVSGVLWRGTKDSLLLTRPGDLKPGDTLVLPLAAGGWNELGFLPEPVRTAEDAPVEIARSNATPRSVPHFEIGIDVAEPAFLEARDRAALRLHPSLRDRFPRNDAFSELYDRATDAEERPTLREWQQLLTAAADSLDDDSDQSMTLKKYLQYLTRRGIGLTCEFYPDGRGVVLITRRRVGAARNPIAPALDDGDDAPSRTLRSRPVLLDDHTHRVVDSVSELTRLLPPGCSADTFELAARLHDLGKADQRFQAMLRRTDVTDVFATAVLLAKSAGKPLNPAAIRTACDRADLPRGFRHEMLSVQLAENHTLLPANHPERDLILHLIAAHHGYARPFAPVITDDNPPAVSLEGVGMTGEERSSDPPHRLDSGIGERFWMLTRRFGWWGLAWLEAVLRLADQSASAAEDAAPEDSDTVDEEADATPAETLS